MNIYILIINTCIVKLSFILLDQIDKLSIQLFHLTEKSMGKTNCTFQVYRNMNARYAIEIGVSKLTP